MRRILLAILLAVGVQQPAFACDCVRLIPGSPRFEADIDRIAQHYPVAAEGMLQADGP